ncbi:MAG: hypothetical protein FJX76_12625 [Armatimonadetes bacterium]|nr:hypothetical protein [Armatimonadota bacterium]
MFPRSIQLPERQSFFLFGPRATGKSTLVHEIKSTHDIRPDKVRGLLAMESAFAEAELFCVSQDPGPQQIGPIRALPWEMALEVL